MAVVVSLNDVVTGLEMQGDESRSYLDPASGEIMLFTDEDMSLIEGEEDFSDLPEWQRDELPKMREAWNSGRLLGLPDKSEIHEWEIMRRFADSRENEELQQELLHAIHGSGAFRMFKDCLRRHEMVDDWHRFRDEQFQQIAKDWLAGHGIAYR